MRERPPINTFVPGRGVLPFLAGRDAEQHELMRLLAYVRAGRGASRSAVLSGPRGNGKTVLLRWFEREVVAAGKSDVVWCTLIDLPSLEVLATTLVPPARFRLLFPDTPSVSIRRRSPTLLPIRHDWTRHGATAPASSVPPPITSPVRAGIPFLSEPHRPIRGIRPTGT